MNNSSTIKEIVNRHSTDYSEFGKPYENYPINTDPTDSCLPGHFLDHPTTANLGMCPDYMAQRCSKNWDGKCELYVDTLDTVKMKNFIRNTASKKFCKLSKDSNCSESCQPFDPILQESPQVCTYIGNETLKDVNETIDVGWYLPVNMSPNYMGTCQQTCDVNTKIEENDPTINLCLRYGFCDDILTSICASTNKDKINNSNLNKFCDIQKTPQKKDITNKEGFTNSNKSYEKLQDGFSTVKRPKPKKMSIFMWGLILSAIIFIILAFDPKLLQKAKTATYSVVNQITK